MNNKISAKSMPRTQQVAHAQLRLQELNLTLSYRLRLFTLVVAAVIMIMGASMVFFGLQGSIDWGLQVAHGLNAKLVNASPGIVFATIGMVLCVVTVISPKQSLPKP